MSARPRAGLASRSSFALAVGLLLAGYAAVRVLELAPRSGPARRAAEEPAAAPDLGGFEALVRAGDVAIRARLLPLHDEPALESFRADALRARYSLPPGAPWRLYLSRAGAGPGGAVRVTGARVPDGPRPFAELARPLASVDPVHALLAAPPGALEAERERPMVLWGLLPPDAALELELETEGGPLAGSSALAPIAAGEDPPAPRWYAEEPAPLGAEPSLAAEVERLERELERERARRAEREVAFNEFNRILAQLPIARELGLAPPTPEPAPPTEEELAAAEAARAARARAEEIGRALAVLMRLEGLRGLDLLEPGTLQGDPPEAIGPVVFRCLDELGRLTGSVQAARLRLEASAAAHTLTVVLEDGHESRGGERVPFAQGERRITLLDVDPEPWLAQCPELFAPEERAPAEPDARWRLSEVRRELNRLLALDTRHGWYRLHSLGGVRGAALTDVQLEELDAGGRLERRFFADTLVVLLEDGSVVLDLEGGAIVRGGEKQPFRDGHHRLLLPGVALGPWLGAKLPGLAPPPEPAAADARGR